MTPEDMDQVDHEELPEAALRLIREFLHADKRVMSQAEAELRPLRHRLSKDLDP